jgi:hypothetical protein
MNYCPCCSEILLQHIRGSEITWFCRHCWQDMPVLTCNLSQGSGLLTQAIREELPIKPKVRENIPATRENVPATSYISQRQKITGWIGAS